jgi:selenocysteine lyase/cysteine desulfurase
MKTGDEVLMTDQEHPGGEHPWNLKAKRYGIVVRKVRLPRPVKNAAQVLNHYLQKKDIDRFLEKLDEYKHEEKLH